MADPVLKEGSRGAKVRELAVVLEELGHCDRVSTNFDRRVRRAVEDFQARNLDSRGRPLVPDGVVGPLTWWALRNPGVNRAEAIGGLALPSTGGSARGRHALAVALTEMRAGAREIGENNAGPFVEKYLNGLAPPPQPWCAAFVSWCFAQHADGIPFRYSLGARDIRDQFQRKGWAFEAGDRSPGPGDVVVWWRGQPTGDNGHIGLVHRLEHGIVYAIEGNKGGFPSMVTRFDYVLSRMDRLLGFGRVP